MKTLSTTIVTFIAAALMGLNASAYPTEDTEKADKAIIVIDMQNDFVEPEGVLTVDAQKPQSLPSRTSSNTAAKTSGR